MADFDNDHLSEFLTHVSRMKAEGTLTARKRAMGQFDQWLTENNYTVAEVGSKQIQYYLADLSEEGYAPNSIESYLDGVSRLFKYLESEGIVKEKPCRRCEPK